MCMYVFNVNLLKKCQQLKLSLFSYENYKFSGNILFIYLFFWWNGFQSIYNQSTKLKKWTTNWRGKYLFISTHKFNWKTFNSNLQNVTHTLKIHTWVLYLSLDLSEHKKKYFYHTLMPFNYGTPLIYWQSSYQSQSQIWGEIVNTILKETRISTTYFILWGTML